VYSLKIQTVRRARDVIDTGQLVTRQYGLSVVDLYNHDHRHSGIRDVILAAPHTGRDHDILAQRHALTRTGGRTG
jgi:hypothetical protein